MVLQGSGIAAMVKTVIYNERVKRERLESYEREKSLSKVVKTLTRYMSINPKIFKEGLRDEATHIRRFFSKGHNYKGKELKKKIEKKWKSRIPRDVLSGWEVYKGKFYPPGRAPIWKTSFAEEFSLIHTTCRYYRGASLLLPVMCDYKTKHYCWELGANRGSHNLLLCFGRCSYYTNLDNIENMIIRKNEKVIDDYDEPPVNISQKWYLFPIKKDLTREGIEPNPGPKTKLKRRIKPQERKDGFVTPFYSVTTMRRFGNTLNSQDSSWNFVEYEVTSPRDCAVNMERKTISNFSWYMQAYSHYKVMWAKVEVSATMRDKNAYHKMFVLIGDEQMSTLPLSYEYLQSLSEKPYYASRTEHLYVYRGPARTMKKFNKIYGDGSSRDVQYFSKLHGDNRTYNSPGIWASVIVMNEDRDQTIPNGVSYDLTITLGIRYWGQRILMTEFESYLHDEMRFVSYFPIHYYVDQQEKQRCIGMQTYYRVPGTSVPIFGDGEENIGALVEDYEYLMPQLLRRFGDLHIEEKREDSEEPCGPEMVEDSFVELDDDDKSVIDEQFNRRSSEDWTPEAIQALKESSKSIRLFLDKIEKN